MSVPPDVTSISAQTPQAMTYEGEAAALRIEEEERPPA